MKGEREAVAEENRQAENERRRLKEERRRANGADSDQSADSIIEDVIEIIKGNKRKAKEVEEVDVEEEQINVSSTENASGSNISSLASSSHNNSSGSSNSVSSSNISVNSEASIDAAVEETGNAATPDEPQVSQPAKSGPSKKKKDNASIFFIYYC